MFKRLRNYYANHKLRLPTLAEIPWVGVLTIGVLCAFLYNNNYFYVDFFDFLSTTAVYTLIAAGLCGLVYLAARNWPMASFSVCAATVALCSYNTLVSKVFIYLPGLYRIRWFLLANALLGLLLLIAALILSTRKHAATIHMGVSIMVAFLLAFNLFGAVRNHLSLTGGDAQTSADAQNAAGTQASADSQADANAWQNAYMDYEYDVSAPARGKNVYYFIFDTMMSPRAAKQYFGAQIDEELNRLREMGFYVPESDMAVAINDTICNIAALLSPRGYDTYLKSEYEKVTELIRTNPGYLEVEEAKNEAKAKILSKANFMYRYRELVMAFQEKGFITPFNNPAEWKPVSEDAPVTAAQRETHVFTSTMQGLIGSTTGISAIRNNLKLFQASYKEQDGRKNAIESTFDEITQTSMDPNHFYFSHFMLPHTPYSYRADGTLLTQDEVLAAYRSEKVKTYTYIEQYTFALRLMADKMEQVIQSDPGAVIIVTGDHGLREYAFGDLMKAFDLDTLDMDIVTNEIFVALRLEEEADAQNNPIFRDPHNIARYLVNTYVGENYAYLQ